MRWSVLRRWQHSALTLPGGAMPRAELARARGPPVTLCPADVYTYTCIHALYPEPTNKKKKKSQDGDTLRLL